MARKKPLGDLRLERRLAVDGESEGRRDSSGDDDDGSGGFDLNHNERVVDLKSEVVKREGGAINA